MMIRLRAWNLAASTCEPFTFEEVEKVVGLLQWAATALPAILPAVACLRKRAYNAAKARCPTLRRASFVLDTQAAAAVSLLFFSLSEWDQKRSLFLGFSPVALAEVVVRTDASTDFGAGGFMWPSFDGFIHRWSADDRETSLLSSEENVRESTMYFELRAIRIALDVFGGALRGKRVQFETDSECAVQCLQKCYSGRPRCQSIIRDIIAICVSLRISPRWEHISACFNDIADCLSHDRLCQAQAHCESELGAQLRVTSCPQ
jgi:ribonuclease HI